MKTSKTLIALVIVPGLAALAFALAVICGGDKALVWMRQGSVVAAAKRTADRVNTDARTEARHQTFLKDPKSADRVREAPRPTVEEELRAIALEGKMKLQALASQRHIEKMLRDERVAQARRDYEDQMRDLGFNPDGTKMTK